MRIQQIIRSVWAAGLVLFLPIFFLSGVASAQLDKQETKCANSINKGAAKVAKAQAGDNSACIKDFGKDKIGSAEACITSDPKGKVAKAISKIKTSDCPGGAPSFLLELKTSSSEIGDIMKTKDLDLIHAIFGVDLDESIVKAAVDKAGAKCQAAVAKAAGKCQDAKLSSFNSCKKDKLKAGDTDIESCLGTGTGGIPDGKGKIQKKCGGDFDLAKKCTGTTTPLDALIPGCAPGVTAACIDQKIECEVCLALNALDGLSRDCDLFDDGTANGSCSTVPSEWMCFADFYGGDDGCDCGCGSIDPDCADGTVGSCDFCSANGSCDSLGDCAILDPTENAVCIAWTCDPAFYGTDDGCDCGCGIVDPDCADGTVGSCEFCDVFGACSSGEGDCPSIINPTDNAVCWTCNLEFFGNNDGCDCGCGSVDADCADGTLGSCEFCGGPGSCDLQRECSVLDPTNNGICVESWTCSLGFYGTDDGCDCGCGLVDPDCADATVGSCEFCFIEGGCDLEGACSLIDPTDNAVCAANWMCSLDFYGTDDGCDCGCGIFDPDCADGTLGSCGFCGSNGSCDLEGQCSVIDPSDNAVCL